MRTIFIIHILLNTLNSVAQELNGNYSTNEPIGGVSIAFDNEQKKFKYSADNCAGGIWGKGTFSVKKNKLYLYFEKKPQLPKIPIKTPLISYDSSEKKDYNITVKVMNNEKADTPIPNVYVRAVGTKVGATTDSDGTANIKLDYPPIDQLITSALDCEAGIVHLKGPGIYSITIFIKCGTAIYIDDGLIQTYEIRYHDKDFIELRQIYLSDEKKSYKKYYRNKDKRITQTPLHPS